MEYRTLGNTGLGLSKLGFGGSPLGGVFRPIDESEGIRAVHTAIDLGVNYFDVAPFYGLTRAETVLGKALHGIPRESVIISTKVGRYGGEDFDFSAARVTASVDESLRRLGLDYADIIICHDIEYVSLDQIINETIPALRRVQETGKVRFIGISGFPLKIFRYVTERTDVDLILSYCHYTLQNTSLAALIPELERKGIGIINAAPLAMGLLTETNLPDWHPATDDLKAWCAAATSYCQERGVNIAELALQFSLSQNVFASTLVGIADPDEIIRNIRWMDEKLDAELLHAVLTILEPVKDQSWRSGRPENDDIA